MPKYNLDVIGDRFDMEALVAIYSVGKMKKDDIVAYNDLIDKIKTLPASYGIVIDAMIRDDRQTLMNEFGNGDLKYFDNNMIPSFVDALVSDQMQLVDPKESARKFNRPLTVLNRMAPIVEEMEAENAGREDAIKDAKTKLDADLRNKKRELKADKSYSRNPFKRWAHRRSEMKKFEAIEKENYDKFCREQKEQSAKYAEKINRYYDAKANGSLIKGGAWVEEMERFAVSFENQKHLATLAKTPLTKESRYYEDAQVIKKQMDLSRQIRTEHQERVSSKQGFELKIPTSQNPMREIQRDDEL